MQETYKIRDLEQVKVLADPLRQRILEALIHGPLTTKQVAKFLGEKPSRLYHHVEALERVGLIRLVRTEKTRGTIAKYYRAVAKSFQAARELLEVTDEEAMRGLDAAIAGILEGTLSEIRQSWAAGLLRPGPDSVQAVISRGHVRATPAQIEALKKRLYDWLRECQRVARRKDGQVEYGLTVMFYPTPSANARPGKSKSRRTRVGGVGGVGGVGRGIRGGGGGGVGGRRR